MLNKLHIFRLIRQRISRIASWLIQEIVSLSEIIKILSIDRKEGCMSDFHVVNVQYMGGGGDRFRHASQI